MASRADIEGGLQFIPSPAREDLDHAADGLGAVQAGARAPDDLDPVHLVEWYMVERRGPQGGRPGLDAVDQHQDMVGFGAPQEQGGLLARASIAGDHHARYGGQHPGQGGCPAPFDCFAGDDGHGHQGLVHGFRSAGRGDDHGDGIVLCRSEQGD